MNKNVVEKLSQKKSGFYYYHVNDTYYSNLTIYDCGYEKYSNQLKIVRNCFPYYLMHCVLTGSGILRFAKSEHIVRKGDIFIIPPETKVEYFQNISDPWSYIYINFSGTAATRFYNEARFSVETLSYPYKKAQMEEDFIALVNCQVNQKHTLNIYSLLYKIMAEIVDERQVHNPKHTQTKSYLATAISYIEKNYHDPEITLSKVSKMLHLNPCYFSRIFHSMTGSTFLKYLTLFRIRKASDLLVHSDLPINEIANTVGYTDPLYFTSVFKHYRLMSPSEYRKTNRSRPSNT